jgi:pimeloyl-ACP methyl ester carboxylesterase
MTATTPRWRSAIIGDMSSIDLATHEWPPAIARPEPRTAVLVHGILGWWKTWWRIGPALAERGWRVIAVDQRAHGSSPAGEPGTIDDLADDLEAAIEQHAGAPVDALIGHSLGAVVSQRLAWLRSDIARRLVLEDPPGITRQDDTEFFAHLRSEVAAARDRPDDEIRRELVENPSWLEEDARQNVEGRALARLDVVIDSMRRGRGFEVAELATEIRIPTRYVLAGADRSVMPEEPRRRLAANLPEGSDIVVLDGGHTLHRDAFDEYLATVLDFIDR